jgi:hypothetical protein
VGQRVQGHRPHWHGYRRPYGYGSLITRWNLSITCNYNFRTICLRSLHFFYFFMSRKAHKSFQDSISFCYFPLRRWNCFKMLGNSEKLLCFYEIFSTRNGEQMAGPSKTCEHPSLQLSREKFEKSFKKWPTPKKIPQDAASWFHRWKT